MNETPETVARNIETILRLEEAAMRRRTPADRVADCIAGFVGSVVFVLLHLVWFGGWASINTGLLPVIRPFDPYPFQLLAMIVSLEGPPKTMSRPRPVVIESEPPNSGSVVPI